MKNTLFFPFWPDPGILFHISFIQYLILIPIALNLLKKKIIISNPETKRKTKILYYSLLVSFIGGGSNYLPCINIPIPPYGNMLVCGFTFGFLYLAFKYQIMDLKITLSRGFAYTILIFIITLSYFATTYITDFYLQRLTGYKSFLFSFLIATFTALAFVPLRNYLQNLIDKFIFKKSIQEVEDENVYLKQEITQSDRLKSIAILASGMAHEIKNPLTVLKTFAEYLPNKMDDKEFLKKFTPMVAAEVNRIDNLVHELLDFARPAAPVLKPVNIHELITNTTELLSNDYLKHNIKINLDLGLDNNTALLLDYNQIKQALLNILLNAIDAMPHGGKFNISTYPSFETDKINIKIQDTGIGINEKDLPHIFDPFFTKKDGGTGLGLAITYEIIKNNGGKIYVESNKDKGTIFILEFPTTLKAAPS
jgi:signal transduction histidine kinase